MHGICVVGCIVAATVYSVNVFVACMTTTPYRNLSRALSHVASFTPYVLCCGMAFLCVAGVHLAKVLQRTK